MIRSGLIFGAVALWLGCFAVAMLTIVPLAAMGLAAIFDGSFTVIARLQGAGFLVLGFLTVAILLIALGRISRLFAKASHAANR